MKSSRISEIDLFRFLAAFAVVLFHYSFRGYAANDKSIMPYPILAPIAKYGYLGVELFFMISGFVILLSANKENVREFFISRAVRLYPAFWICCTLTYIFTVFLGENRYMATFSQYLLNLTMLGDFFEARPIDGVYWSLFVEIRFYLLIAIVLYFRKLHNIEPVLCIWLGLTYALEFIKPGVLHRILITDYAAYFVAGAIFFQIWSNGKSLRRLIILAAAFVIANYQAIESLQKYENHYKTQFSELSVSLILAIFFIVMWCTATRKFLFISKINWFSIGAITYPLYLLHQNIGFMIFNAIYPNINAHTLLWGTVIGMIIASYLIHRMIERPLAKRLRSLLIKLFERVSLKQLPKV